MHKFILSAIILAAIVFSGCNKTEEKADETAASMKQIHQEKGVPVRTETVVPKAFSTHHSYFASLSGIEESTASAGINERVERIYFNVGDKVKKGQVVVTFPADNSQAQYNQAKVGFENAKAAYERMSKLKVTGGISIQDFDNVKAQYDVAKANFAASSKLIRVTAPISGRITRMNVTETQNVSPGTELFTVARTDKMKASIWVPENEIMDVKNGAPVDIEWNGVLLTGIVSRVDHALNPQRQAFGALVEVNNPYQKVISGVTAEFRIQTYSNPSALILEKQHLITGDEGQYVFVASAGKGLKRAVQTGKQQGLQVEIINGLQAAEEVITAGQHLVTNGDRINVIQ